MTGERYRLAVVANRPQPYHAAFFRALAAHPRLDLTVYYLYDIGVGRTADSDFGRYRHDYPVLDGYPSRFLANRAPFTDRRRFLSSFHPEVFSRVHPRHHDALLVQGWFGLSVWLAYFAARVRRLPILFRSEANPANPVRARWVPAKRFLLPRLLGGCQAFLAIGARNRAFYRALGVAEEKVFLAPYAVDNEFFQGLRARFQPRREEIRRDLGLPPGAVAILYAGRLAREKRLADLLRAVHRLADPRAWLVLAGEGRERRALEQQARALGLEQIIFAGLQGQEGLARHYVGADVFVLPSGREPWGLVINEAMNFGLPVVASQVVGAVPDLVEEDANGFVFPAGDVEALASALRSLVADPGLRARFGARSGEKIREWSHAASADSVLRALAYARRGAPAST